MLSKLEDVVLDPSVIDRNMTPSRPATGSRPQSRTGRLTPSRNTGRVNSGTLGRPKKGPSQGEGDARLSAGAVGVSDLERDINQGLPDIQSLDTSERGIENMMNTAKSLLTSTSTEWEHRINQLRNVLF